MKFQRRVVDTQSREALRALGARDGWLIETADVIRVGFGTAVDGPGEGAGGARTGSISVHGVPSTSCRSQR